MPRQLSTSWTLALRIFLPTLWLTFFGAFLISVLFTDKSTLGGLPVGSLRIGLALFIAVFLFVFWKTLFQIKRIDADKDYVYITNYFKNVRYPHSDVEKIELAKGLIFNYATMFLKGKGTFGDRITFLASRKRLELFLLENPELAHWVVEV
jgi:hypothetical protein